MPGVVVGAGLNGVLKGVVGPVGPDGCPVPGVVVGAGLNGVLGPVGPMPGIQSVLGPVEPEGCPEPGAIVGAGVKGVVGPVGPDGRPELGVVVRGSASNLLLESMSAPLLINGAEAIPPRNPAAAAARASFLCSVVVITPKPLGLST